MQIYYQLNQRAGLVFPPAPAIVCMSMGIIMSLDGERERERGSEGEHGQGTALAARNQTFRREEHRQRILAPRGQGEST